MKHHLSWTRFAFVDFPFFSLIKLDILGLKNIYIQLLNYILKVFVTRFEGTLCKIWLKEKKLLFFTASSPSFRAARCWKHGDLSFIHFELTVEITMEGSHSNEIFSAKNYLTVYRYKNLNVHIFWHQRIEAKEIEAIIIRKLLIWGVKKQCFNLRFSKFALIFRLFFSVFFLFSKFLCFWLPWRRRGFL